MLRKYKLILFVFVLLFGCTTHRNEISENQEISQSAPVTRSEIAVPNSESYGTVEVIGGDEQTLREFIQRWFTPLYAAPSSPSDDDTTVTIGALPEDLPLEFPLPEQGVIFASVKSPYDVQIMLDVPMNDEDLMAAYSKILEAASWMQRQEDVQGGGFVSSFDDWHVFCDEQSQVALILQSYPKSTQETEMRITLYDKDVHMCDPQGIGGQDQVALMLPVLEAPAGARVTSGGSSSGNGTAESSSDITTDLTPRELNAHYSSQMEAAKWNRLDSGDAANFSWSSWQTTDDQGDLWNGTLIILKNPVEEDLVYAMMRVVKELK